MMNITEEYKYGPADIAKFTGVEPDVQRDWRRRGILPSEDVPGICVRNAGGRWLFTFDGLHIVYVTRRFVSLGFDLIDAYIFAQESVIASKFYMLHKDAGEPGIPEKFQRYLLIYPANSLKNGTRSASTVVGKWEFEKVHDLSQGRTVRPEFVHVVDLIRLSDSWSDFLSHKPDGSSDKQSKPFRETNE